MGCLEGASLRKERKEEGKQILQGQACWAGGADGAKALGSAIQTDCLG